MLQYFTLYYYILHIKKPYINVRLSNDIDIDLCICLESKRNKRKRERNRIEKRNLLGLFKRKVKLKK